MIRTIHSKTTLAESKHEKLIRVPATFQIDGELNGAEEIEFFLAGIDGTITTQPWVDEDEQPIKFTASQIRPISVYSPLDIYIVKPVTVNAVGIKLVGTRL